MNLYTLTVVPFVAVVSICWKKRSHVGILLSRALAWPAFIRDVSAQVVALLDGDRVTLDSYNLPIRDFTQLPATICYSEKGLFMNIT